MHRLFCFSVIVAGCVALGCSGCDALTNLTKAKSGSLTHTSYPQITTFEGLEGQLLFGPPIVKRGTYQPIHVAIPVRAAHDQPQRVQYRFEYFNSSGRPLRPSMDWRYLLLPVGGERIMDGSALNTTAVDWRLEVRRTK